jgi:hypothetical protein
MILSDLLILHYLHTYIHTYIHTCIHTYIHTGPYLVRLYYRLMGASIGRNVTIHKDAKLGQADLLTIGEATYTSYIFTSSY